MTRQCVDHDTRVTISGHLTRTHSVRWRISSLGNQTSRQITCCLSILLAFISSPLRAQEPPTEPKNYALLVAVTTYDHAGLNGDLPLKFPEKDALAVGRLLQQSGYEVEYLLGPAATRKAILATLDLLSTKANASGVCAVGFFGHGTQAEFPLPDGSLEIQGCFCPFDTGIRPVINADGQPLYEDGKPKTEPLPQTLLKMSEVVSALNAAKGGSRLLIADCCRDMSHRPRGRNLGLGANYRTDRLPNQTVMLFGCSPGEEAFERDDWGHGAFTRALLEELILLSSNAEPVTSGTLADRVKHRVQQMTGQQQNPMPISLGSINLQLRPIPAGSFINRAGAIMIAIPPGEFLMGSKEREDEDRERVEQGRIFGMTPYRRIRVKIQKLSHLSQTEVTVGQFRQFVEAENYVTEAEKNDKGGVGFDALIGNFVQDRRFTWKNPGFPQTDDHPVVNVSWNDADAYCQWLSRIEGREYRLPTEAEWEYACRAGTETKASFGDSPCEAHHYANALDSSYMTFFTIYESLMILHRASLRNLDQERDSRLFFARFDFLTGSDGYVFTSPVGAFRPNPFCLHDMHGNVREWCSDWLAARDPDSDSPRIDPTGPRDGSERVRGGDDFLTYTRFIRSTSRGSGEPQPNFATGFRIALSHSDPQPQ